MHEVMRELVSAIGDGQRTGLVTVVSTFKSAPRPPGASMAVTRDGEAVGSVSGGCIEGAVYELAQEVMDGRPPVLQRYGVSDDDAFAVGLTCGGIIDVFVEAVDAASFPSLPDLASSVESSDPVAVATVVRGPGTVGAHLVIWPDRVAGTLGGQRLDDAVTDDARGMLEQGMTGIRRYGADGERRLDELEVFVQSFAPRPRMLVFGAIDFAAALVRIGRFLGYHVTVCDARPVFATPRRFPDADDVVVQWPHDYLAATEVDPRTVICVLTHDPKFDVPLLEAAVRTPAAYIGVMGSRRTHDDRVSRLRERGLGDDELSRLSSPLGLDIGARTPEETAVSIAAEIIAARWGASGQRLSDTTGPIHREPLAADVR
ncbi:XdhC family protein [Jiangella gansuensis]|uniref:XdhC family protein n=1 Tax=Jiangella gansuensis TaxID=281473 RepID=UPI00047D05AF|nr:XdhC/CoxI family protein [Jiangella gansuensis]